MTEPRYNRSPWTHLGHHIKNLLEDAVKKGPTSIAAVANVGKTGSHVSVYTDNNVTITNNDGEVEVVHHRQGGNADPAGAASVTGHPPMSERPNPEPRQ